MSIPIDEDALQSAITFGKQTYYLLDGQKVRRIIQRINEQRVCWRHPTKSFDMGAAMPSVLDAVIGPGQYLVKSHYASVVGKYFSLRRAAAAQRRRTKHRPTTHTHAS